jgi:hypothetical protein
MRNEMMNRDEALAEVRKRMREKKGGRQRDPMEFRPPQVKPDEILKYKFVVLPGIQKGDTCVGGKVSNSMSLWFTPAGTHWINNRPFECPRIHDGNDCPYCQLGFDLLNETDDDTARRNIAKTYLPRVTYVVNIWFPPFESTPTELRNKVMFYSMPKTVFDIMEATIMRDVSNDPDDPQAYGLFYDPENCYVFQLEVHRQGEFNEYKQGSKFLPNTLGPLVKGKDGKPNTAAIEKILSLRHDVFTKFAGRDAKVLAQKVKEVMSGEPERQPTQKAKPAPAPAQTPASTPVESEDKLIEEPAEPAPKTAVSATAVKKAVPAATKSTPAPAEAAVEDPNDDELEKLLNDIKSTK